MALYKLYMIIFALKTATCTCSFEHKNYDFAVKKVEISKLGLLPSCINENSGLVKAWQDNYYWTHNDGGGSAELYMINGKGYVFDTMDIEDATNVDWEDLAKDTKGNIYIGDFGNNNSNRKDLVIYKKNYFGTEKIKFKYADQDFANNSDLVFDCEAFFWHNDSLYLFTKSWNKGKKLTKMYVVPDKPGEYTLNPSGASFFKTQVTGADISPKGDKFALITYGKVFFYDIKNGKISLDNPTKCIKIGKNQTEAIVFENDNKIIFSNEQGKIYSFEI